MGVKVTNNAYGTLSAGIASGDTTITLDGGQGARFPTLGAGDYFYGTLIDTGNNIEVVKVTARSTDSMTVVRGQDNTTARAYAIGDRFELRPTAALFDDIQTQIDNVDLSSRVATAGDTMTGALGIFGTSNGRFGAGLSVKGNIPEVHLKRDDGNGEGGVLLDNASSTQRLFVGTYNSNQETHIGTNGTQRIVVNGAGHVTLPSQPCFSANQFAGNGTRSTGVSNTASWTFNTILINRGNYWNNSAGEFICPTDGLYYAVLNFNRRTSDANWHGGVILQNSNARAQGWFPPGPSTNFSYAPNTMSCIINASANDAIVPAFYTNYLGPSTALENQFSVWLIA